MRFFHKLFRKRSRKSARSGQTLVEYSLILGLVVLVCVGALAFMGNRVTVLFSAITTLLDTAQTTH